MKTANFFFVCVLFLLGMLEANAQNTTPVPASEGAEGTWQCARGSADMNGFQRMKGKFTNAPTVKWRAPLTTSVGGGEGEATIGDINGDGKNEVLISVNEGTLMVFNGATGSLVWQKPGMSPGASASPLIGDANGDSIMDIVEAGQNLYLLDGATGNMIWNFTPPNMTSFGIGGCVNMADLDKDGMTEVLFVNNNACYALNGLNGTVKWKYSAGPPSTVIPYNANGSTPAVGDLNGDGFPDVVAFLMNGAGTTLAAIDGNSGTAIWTITGPAPGVFANPVPAIADINGDCKPEVVFNSCALNGQTGATLWGNPIVKGALFTVAADLNDDCNMEVITYYEVREGKTGNLIWRRNITPSGWYAPAPKIGDFNSTSPGKEIIFSASYNISYPINMLRGMTGDTIWSFSMSSINHSSEGIAVGDIDNDGCVEIVVSPDCCNGEGTLLALDDIGNSVNCGIYPLNNAVDFLPKDSSLCGLCIDFRDNSSYCASGWDWSFPGGNPSSSGLKNPGMVCYDATGAHQVILIAKANGCRQADTIVRYITANAPGASPVITRNFDTLFATNGFAFYQWYYEGKEITGANNDYYVVTQLGTYSLKVKDDNGCEYFINDIVITGVKPLEFNSGFTLFPNPAHESVTITADASTPAESIEVYSTLGIMLLQKEFSNRENTIVLDVSSFPNGIYFIRIKAGYYTSVEKLVIR